MRKISKVVQKVPTDRYLHLDSVKRIIDKVLYSRFLFCFSSGFYLYFLNILDSCIGIHFSMVNLIADDWNKSSFLKIWRCFLNHFIGQSCLIDFEKLFLIDNLLTGHLIVQFYQEQHFLVCPLYRTVRKWMEKLCLPSS